MILTLPLAARLGRIYWKTSTLLKEWLQTLKMGTRANGGESSLGQSSPARERMEPQNTWWGLLRPSHFPGGALSGVGTKGLEFLWLSSFLSFPLKGENGDLAT